MIGAVIGGAVSVGDVGGRAVHEIGACSEKAPGKKSVDLIESV